MSDFKEKIYAELQEVIDNDDIVITDEMPLIGDGSVLDSMKVVSLCIALEDVAADLGFEFDWTSNAAMSRSRSMFRSVGALVEEFTKQMKAQQ
ncbi:acyl carrier protein [Sphingomonas elodea]|uniref:acyl carrier protein n=1 Tax=Sphingomonas elodea TaxID=179878 RepID=UPI0002631010|nr:acyl carrier protein [Sphingomonas elodea]